MTRRQHWLRSPAMGRKETPPCVRRFRNNMYQKHHKNTRAPAGRSTETESTPNPAPADGTGDQR
jgi:hypothetical protein